MDYPVLNAARTALAASEDVSAAAIELFRRRAEYLLPIRATYRDLQVGALDRWHGAFDALELLTRLCREVALEYESEWIADVQPTTDLATLAMRDIFWSGHLVANEVLALLRSGYSTGALARWRALHEIATRAEFIAGAGPFAAATARRYLDHEMYRSRLEHGLYQAFAKKAEPHAAFSADDMKQFAALNDELVAEYGAIFRGEYGWAHEQLVASDDEYRRLFDGGDRPRGPTFPDLERTVRSEVDEPRYWRLLYSTASAAVHGAPRVAAALGDDGELASYQQGPDLEALALSPAGKATARRLLALLCAVTHPYPMDEDDDDEDEQQRLDVLWTAAALCGIAEGAFSAPTL